MICFNKDDSRRRRRRPKTAIKLSPISFCKCNMDNSHVNHELPKNCKVSKQTSINTMDSETLGLFLPSWDCLCFANTLMWRSWGASKLDLCLWSISFFLSSASSLRSWNRRNSRALSQRNRKIVYGPDWLI